MGPRHNGLILAGRHKINHDATHLAPVLNGLPFGATFTFFLARFASWCDVRLKTETTPCETLLNTTGKTLHRPRPLSADAYYSRRT